MRNWCRDHIVIISGVLSLPHFYSLSSNLLKTATSCSLQVFKLLWLQCHRVTELIWRSHWWLSSKYWSSWPLQLAHVTLIEREERNVILTSQRAGPQSKHLSYLEGNNKYNFTRTEVWIWSDKMFTVDSESHKIPQWFHEHMASCMRKKTGPFRRCKHIFRFVCIFIFLTTAI